MLLTGNFTVDLQQHEYSAPVLLATHKHNDNMYSIRKFPKFRKRQQSGLPLEQEIINCSDIVHAMLQ